MKLKQWIALSLTALAVLITSTALAQENETFPSERFQFTFTYPLGTNGTEAINESNNVSLNMLFGVNGGLDGLEIGGILNYNHGMVNGAQFSGVGNINRGQTSGLMCAGSFNLVLDDARGVQLADLNNTSGDFYGVQTGVINYAGSLRGVQLGVINIVGEDNGALPIGLINVVKGGYYALELVASEVLHTNVNYKMGVEHFYTIFKLGFSGYDKEPVYSAGLGFGSMVTLSEKHQISMDLSFNNIVYDEKWEADENFLTKLELAYRFRVGEHVSLVSGPSLNLYTSDMTREDVGRTLDIPSHAHSFSCKGFQNRVWLGFNAGISFTF